VTGDDSIVVGRVEVTKYIRADGREYWDMDYAQDQSLTSIVGLLQCATMELYRRAVSEDPEVD
jgi:hypothetical protein